MSPTDVEHARRVVAMLAGRGLTLGTCESLTGGGLAALLTAVPGASQVFRGALVTYASDLKVSLVGVDADEVERHGVVNRATALAMARGARQRLGVDLAASCTGVAGPTAQDGQPPGTVWIAVAGSGTEVVRELHLAGGREEVRVGTVRALLDLVTTTLA